jgi:hypothetical protein
MRGKPTFFGLIVYKAVSRGPPCCGKLLNSKGAAIFTHPSNSGSTNALTLVNFISRITDIAYRYTYYYDCRSNIETEIVVEKKTFKKSEKKWRFVAKVLDVFFRQG